MEKWGLQHQHENVMLKSECLQVLAGFAGATADALTLLERLESQLDEHPGQLLRASVEMAKSWRTDKYLRKLGKLHLQNRLFVL